MILITYLNLHNIPLGLPTKPLCIHGSLHTCYMSCESQLSWFRPGAHICDLNFQFRCGTVNTVRDTRSQMGHCTHTPSVTLRHRKFMLRAICTTVPHETAVVPHTQLWPRSTLLFIDQCTHPVICRNHKWSNQSLKILNCLFAKWKSILKYGMSLQKITINERRREGVD